MNGKIIYELYAFGGLVLNMIIVIKCDWRFSTGEAISISPGNNKHNLVTKRCLIFHENEDNLFSSPQSVVSGRILEN